MALTYLYYHCSSNWEYTFEVHLPNRFPFYTLVHAANLFWSMSQNHGIRECPRWERTLKTT